MATPLKGTPAYEQRFTPRVGRPNEEAETFEETPLTFRRVFGFDAPPTSRVGAGAVREKPEGEGEYGRYFRQIAGEIFQPKGVKPTQRVPTRKQEEKAPTTAPESVKPEPAKAPEPEAKPEAPRRIFRAMVQGDPAKDQIFETKKEAEDYLKNQGLKGVVAGIRFKGETPEDIAQKEKEYRGALVEEKGRKGALERLYATRKQDAMTRQAQMRSAVAELEAATTPEQRALAKGKIESARLATIFEQGTRGLPEKQKEKLRGSLLGVVSRRAEREEKRASEIAQARAESQRTAEERAESKAGVEAERIYTRLIGPMYRAAREARRQGDFGAEAYYTQMAEMQSKDVPKEVGARRRFFQSDAGKVKTQNVLDFYARQEAAAQEAARRNRNPTK